MKTIKYRLEVLKSRAAHNPTGRAASFLNRGKIEGDLVALDEATHREILAQFPQKLPLEYSVTKLQLPGRLRPVGFVDFVLARGKIEGDTVALDDAAHKELQELFYPTASA